MTIPYDSNHPISHKLSAYNSMIHRAVSIPMSIHNFNKEISIIKQIAIGNGYQKTLIDNLLQKKQQKLAISLIFPKQQNEPKKYTSLTYFGNISTQISKIISHTTTHNISFKSFMSNGSILLNAKEKLSKLQKPGIYRLNCSDCNSVYIGQTCRNLEIRYKEHLNSYRLKHPERSNFAKHLIENNHNLTTNNKIELLHYCDHYFKLNFLEALEIHRHSHNQNYTIINEQLDTYHSPFLDFLLDVNN